MAILIFDFDGTIHDSMCIYAPAVRACQKAFAARGLLPDREIPDAQIRGYLGLTAEQMWLSFAPELPESLRHEGSQFIYREMERLARLGKARLYDGALLMLQELKNQGHWLVFLSNCSAGYMNLHSEVFGLDHIFHEMYCAGQFDWEEKPGIVKQLLPGWKKLPLSDRSLVAIGDRYTDMAIGQECQTDCLVRTIFCAYGFGSPEEGRNADEKADFVTEIPEAVRKICEGL